MLDKVLHAHLDEIDEIEGDIEEDIDKLMKSIDISAVMDNPEAAMLGYADEVKNGMQDKYAEPSVKAGIEFGVTIKALDKKDEDITVELTDDPKLNEEESDDRRKD